jgi:choline dehydrogenase-like flavoprotein
MDSTPDQFVADFVIIGGGSSGLVLAHRLSEDPDVRVLVLESGQDLSTNANVQDPLAWQSLLGTDADWNLRTVPQVSCFVSWLITYLRIVKAAQPLYGRLTTIAYVVRSQ